MEITGILRGSSEAWNHKFNLIGVSLTKPPPPSEATRALLTPSERRDKCQRMRILTRSHGVKPTCPERRSTKRDKGYQVCPRRLPGASRPLTALRLVCGDRKPRLSRRRRSRLVCRQEASGEMGRHPRPLVLALLFEVGPMVDRQVLLNRVVPMLGPSRRRESEKRCE